MSRSQKTVIVTGASSGIGFGVAQALIARGDNVVLNGRDESRLVAAAKRLGAPDQIAIAVGDIGANETPSRLVEAALSKFGRVDGLLNNAGHFDAKPLAEYSNEDFDGYLGFLRGAFFNSQAVITQFREQGGGGSIVNITTNLTTRGMRDVPSSGPIAAKGGIQAITHNMAIEVANEGITINAVAPGLVRTPLLGDDEKTLDQLGAMHPMGRLGEVSEIVDAVLYMLDATWTTGVVLPVDGGLAAGA